MNLPMIFQKSKVEGLDFYKVLDYYMEMVRNISKRTIDYLGNLKASSSPLMFMEGGVDGGNLKADDKIAPILKGATISYGIIALNEVGMLHNGKSLYQDQEFTLEVIKYIKNKADENKKKDKILYAIYQRVA